MTYVISYYLSCLETKIQGHLINLSKLRFGIDYTAFYIKMSDIEPYIYFATPLAQMRKITFSSFTPTKSHPSAGDTVP